MTKYEIIPSKQFGKDVKLAKKRGYDLNSLTNVIKMLADGGKLPDNLRDHSLSDNFIGFRECHISPDWLLIYEIRNDQLILYLSRTGSHSDLF